MLSNRQSKIMPGGSGRAPYLSRMMFAALNAGDRETFQTYYDMAVAEGHVPSEKTRKQIKYLMWRNCGVRDFGEAMSGGADNEPHRGPSDEASQGRAEDAILHHQGIGRAMGRHRADRPQHGQQ